MKSQYFSLLIALASIGLALAPAEGNAATGCSAKLRVIENEIASSYGGRVTQAFITSNTKHLPFKVDISMARPSPLPEKPRFAIILLDGDYTRNSKIMSNKSLLRNLAQSILRSCPDVASVKFNWMWWTEGISSHKDGQLLMDKCVHPSERTSGPRWGENLCKY